MSVAPSEARKMSNLRKPSIQHIAGVISMIINRVMTVIIANILSWSAHLW